MKVFKRPFFTESSLPPQGDLYYTDEIHKYLRSYKNSIKFHVTKKLFILQLIKNNKEINISGVSKYLAISFSRIWCHIIHLDEVKEFSARMREQF